MASLEAEDTSELERLRAFARRVLQVWPEGDLDGGELQQAAVEAGLLVPEQRCAPCGEHCQCVEYHGHDGMVEEFTCYRLAPSLISILPTNDEIDGART